jgi:hypothetical protein
MKESMDRSKRNELLHKLKKLDFNDKRLKEKNIENLKSFILSLSKDESASFYLKILDDNWDDIYSDVDPIILEILDDERFVDILEKIEKSTDKADEIDV